MDFKYLAAYSIPLSVLLGYYAGGIFYWLTPVYTFGLVPVLELILPVNTGNLNQTEREQKKKLVLFDLLLYLNILMVYAIVFYTLYLLKFGEHTPLEIAGIIFSCGIAMGSNGINVAHELGHRPDRLSKTLAKVLLLPSLYMHFYVEHNFGHHLHAATKEDPATARFNQSVYSFWITSVLRQYRSAWQIQMRLLQQDNKGFFSLQNDMLWGGLLECVYLVLIGIMAGWQIALFAVIMALVSILMLETINYIEHYGLLRHKMNTGRYERVQTIHSWNSNHVMGRIMLYELTRHSDHHYRASKKYQLLDYHQESPQMPYGYPTSMVLSLFPPLWFRIMNPLIPADMKPQAA
ncbi:alkane 1-monooxygenase [Robertkochia marina]|uniref:Alkane 1-monooxygenase n=2 Tax=Robertkochia marina TaxID=1227945 RepID=A0A4S3M486_9FLAO|nr:alkane 1-monooxygenase [Robertkochia marina]THD70012.1 alkane 1-monooxygenase [Robertkochia marina]TRZ47663.1 alkane 1-monooxygenase [Robertkochia marina]